MKSRRLTLISFIVMLVVACSCPATAGVGTNVPPTATDTAAAGPAAPSETSTATATNAPPPTACSPTATANLNANVRSGPGTLYNQVGALLLGQSATVAGKSSDGTWWYIVFPAGPGGYGWISGSVVTATCIPASLVVVPAPPLPPTLTPTPTEVPAVFAVTHVSYSLSYFNDGSYHHCPVMTASITANGAGNVHYHWTRSDGASAPTQTVHFSSAGTEDVSEQWYLGSVWAGSSHWLGIYIDSPNDQDFGHKTFNTACTSP
jgi:SH3 domain-containing protein